MSEVKLNLIDSQQTIHGTIHGSLADRCVAALSAEPETIAELEAALSRYIKPHNGISPFAWFRIDTELDEQPWDAGIVIIDLAARIVAAESTYSQPGPNGQVDYHNGECATDITVFYRVPDDWLFLNSVEEYRCRRNERAQHRLSTPLDTRAVLYGPPLLVFVSNAFVSNAVVDAAASDYETESDTDVTEPSPLQEALVSAAHIQWLMTPRDDLRGKSPREVLLEKQDFIDYDIHTRSMQWSLLGEGPPCLAMDSFAYRFGGFGTHEWVIYYDLVRHLLFKAFEHVRQASLRSGPDVIDHLNSATQPIDKLRFVEQEIARLEEIKRDWLETPQPEYGGRTPAILIQSERRRLPITISGRDLIIDEACPVCQMMAAESELGHEVSFWHLDGSHMDDDFAFSPFLMQEEWEADRREWKAFTEKFNREWEERHGREFGDQTADELIDERDDFQF